MGSSVRLTRKAANEHRHRGLGWLSLAGLVSVVLVLTVSQLILPGIATHRLESSLARNGQDVRVSLSAFPAVELLFGQANTVVVHIRKLTSRASRVGNLLARAQGVGTLNATVGELDTHGLILTDVSLEKRGGTITATGTVTRAAVQALLPFNLTVIPTAAGAAGLLIHGSITILGHTIAARARVAAQDGKIILHPDLSGPTELLDPLDITVFDNPAVWIDHVTAVSRGGSYTLTASGHYR